ncbi:MAG TPA: hypothetical protein VMV05_12440 [bacterium]|nr:hypothetical protein [bacterium]
MGSFFRNWKIEAACAGLALVLGNIAVFFQSYGWWVIVLANVLILSGIYLVIHIAYVRLGKSD